MTLFGGVTFRLPTVSEPALLKLPPLRFSAASVVGTVVSRFSTPPLMFTVLRLLAALCVSVPPLIVTVPMVLGAFCVSVPPLIVTAPMVLGAFCVSVPPLIVTVPMVLGAFCVSVPPLIATAVIALEPFNVSSPAPLIVVVPLNVDIPAKLRLPPDRFTLASALSVLPDCAPAVSTTVPAVGGI